MFLCRNQADMFSAARYPANFRSPQDLVQVRCHRPAQTRDFVSAPQQSADLQGGIRSRGRIMASDFQAVRAVERRPININWAAGQPFIRGERTAAPTPIRGPYSSFVHAETDVARSGGESIPASIPPDESAACQEKQRQNDQKAQAITVRADSESLRLLSRVVRG